MRYNPFTDQLFVVFKDTGKYRKVLDVVQGQFLLSEGPHRELRSFNRGWLFRSDSETIIWRNEKSTEYLYE